MDEKTWGKNEKRETGVQNRKMQYKFRVCTDDPGGNVLREKKGGGGYWVANEGEEGVRSRRNELECLEG